MWVEKKNKGMGTLTSCRAPLSERLEQAGRIFENVTAK